MTHVVLSLQLGTTRVRQDVGTNRARDVLAGFATAARGRVPEYSDTFTTEISLQPTSLFSRAANYETAHVFGRSYLGTLPTDEELTQDLVELTRLYRLLTYRGGLLPLESSPDLDNYDLQDFLGIEDRQRLGFHFRVERNHALAEQAKRIHGYSC